MTHPNIYEVKLTVIMPFWSDQESPIDLIHDALGISDLEIISYEDQRMALVPVVDLICDECTEENTQTKEIK
jgi:hypothetical protein